MQITLYQYTGDRRKVNKTASLVSIGTFNGHFKAPTSIYRPTLLLTAQISNDEIVDFNYFFIKETKRFYFLTEYILMPNHMMEISGEVDVLNTFQSQILQQSCYIERTAGSGANSLLPDESFPLSPFRTATETRAADMPLYGTREVNFSFDLDGETNFNNIVIGYSSQSYYSCSFSAWHGLPNLFPAMDSKYFVDNKATAYAVMDYSEFNSLITELMSEASAYATFFKSAVALPYSLGGLSTWKEGVKYPSGTVSIPLYKWDGSTNQFSPVTLNTTGTQCSGQSGYLCLADFDLPDATHFYELYPYSHYEIYIPFYGYYELTQYNQIKGDRIQLLYIFDYADGRAQIILWDVSKSRILFVTSSQIGIPLSLTSTNAEEIATAKQAAKNNLILSLVGSGIGAIGSAVGGNVLGAVGSGLNAVSSITAYQNNIAQMWEKSSFTPSGSGAGLLSPVECRFRKELAQPVTNLTDSVFIPEFGRPCRAIRLLSACSGWTICGNVKLSGIPASDGEKSEIKALLESGVIL